MTLRTWPWPFKEESDAEEPAACQRHVHGNFPHFAHGGKDGGKAELCRHRMLILVLSCAIDSLLFNTPYQARCSDFPSSLFFLWIWGNIRIEHSLHPCLVQHELDCGKQRNHQEMKRAQHMHVNSGFSLWESSTLCPTICVGASWTQQGICAERKCRRLKSR